MGEHEHPCFFCWLAGFIDGEGCFSVKHTQQRTGRITYQCNLVLAVRIDDKPVLDEIKRRTGIGCVRHHRPSPRSFATRPGVKPQVKWMVETKRDCARLVVLLEQHHQHAKKRRDFEIWAAAVRRWQTKKTNRRDEWSDMAGLKRELEAVRASGLDGYEPVMDSPEAEHQLSLVDRDADQGQVVAVPL